MPSLATFSPEKDIPDLSGKVIFVTGGNTGLGKSAITHMAAHNASQIFLSGRTASKCTEAISDIKSQIPDANITFVECDLTSLASVKKAAQDFLAQSQRLDVLMLNAGIMAVPAAQTKDGYEIQFGTNHVGHALLTKLLLPTLKKTASEPNSDVRVVALSSMGLLISPTGGIVFDTLKTPQADIGTAGPWLRYGQSKLANVLYARSLAEHHPELLTASIHPGIVQTQLISSLPWYQRAFVRIGMLLTPTGSKSITPEEGSWNQTWAATAPREQLLEGEGKGNGIFWEPVGQVGQMTDNTKSKELADKLWEWTEKELEGWSLD
ncbi:oxidoreductase [Aulographum hederae CBS 113979]|uniref:Oxidoreductase n=1 Tax=Aulographum hederae CBS 113979 TaxID=1176131 RepID=A0A6G1GLJ0_9PEZI|nr:oxidoreductase [Aulographum hederae CBS 113979]